MVGSAEVIGGDSEMRVGAYDFNLELADCGELEMSNRHLDMLVRSSGHESWLEAQVGYYQ